MKKLLIFFLLFTAMSTLSGMQRNNIFPQKDAPFLSLPHDLRRYILHMIANAPNQGTFDQKKGLDYSDNLADAIKNVKNAMISHRAFTYFDDERFTTDLMQVLFQRFPHIKKALIAAKLNTTGAGKWIQQYAQTPYGLNDTINTFTHLAEFGAARDLDFMIRFMPQLINTISTQNFDSQTKDVTPLMAASREGNLRAVEQLLAVAGIDVHKKNNAQRDAQWYAQQSKSVYKDEIIKKLQSYGAQ